MPKPFDSPRQKIAQAKRHHDQLVEIHNEYVSTVKVGFVKVTPSNDDLNTDNSGQIINWYSCRFTSEPVPEISSYAVDVIHNLRNVFDQSVCDLARSRSKNAKGLSWPFAKTKEDLERMVKETKKFKPLRSVGSDLSDFIINFGGWHGGHNEWMRLLHDLDVMDKHNVTFPSYLVAHYQNPMMNAMKEMIKKSISEDTDNKSLWQLAAANYTIPYEAGGLLMVKNDLKPADMLIELDGGIRAIIPRDLPFGGKELLPLLNELIKTTEKWLDHFIEVFKDA